MNHTIVNVILSLCIFSSGSVTGYGQSTVENATKLSSQFIPDDAIALIYASPSKILSDPDLSMMPIEILQAQSLETVGIDPLHVEEIKVIVGMPGPDGPVGGMAIQLSQGYDISDLNPQLLRSTEPEVLNGLQVYGFRDGPPDAVLHRLDGQTWILAVGGYFEAMLEAEDGTGQLPALVARIPEQPGVTAVVALNQIRPLLTGLLMQSANQLPPPLQELSKASELTDSLLLNLRLGNLFSSQATLVALCGDEQKSVELERILNQSIDFGRDLAIQSMQENVSGEGPVHEATIQYVNRISGQLSDRIRPQRKGNRVAVRVEGNIGSTGVLVGLLLPAVQAAREAARRTTASNHLKVIGLAMHNYHSAFGQLPESAIHDENGKPLLSWRVKILPFVEQEALYDQFHLDEAWDSPHNIQLLDKMPEIYHDPSVDGPAGHTVFQIPMGEGLILQPNGVTRFRDITDGSSNTIMVVETNRDAAVPWTKPDDIEIDLNNPLKETGNTHPGGFYVLMADGAVRFVSNAIDVETLRGLFTRAGNEVVNF